MVDQPDLPDTLLARLCALVPPPGAHTVRYHGVLAGHHALRSRIIPRPEPPQPPKQLALFIPYGPLDMSVCPRCAGPMRVTRAVTTPEQIAAELRGARPPPRPQPPAQLLLFSPPDEPRPANNTVLDSRRAALVRPRVFFDTLLRHPCARAPADLPPQSAAEHAPSAPDNAHSARDIPTPPPLTQPPSDFPLHFA
ncbi:MAG: transposase [Nannocystaceae bacterium]